MVHLAHVSLQTTCIHSLLCTTDTQCFLAELVSNTCVRGKALNSHTVREMALVHVKGTFKHGQAVLSSRDKSDIEFAAQNQVTYLTVPFVCTAADVIEVSGLHASEVQWQLNLKLYVLAEAAWCFVAASLTQLCSQHQHGELLQLSRRRAIRSGLNVSRVTKHPDYGSKIVQKGGLCCSALI